MLPHIHGWIAFGAIVVLLLVVDLLVVHRKPHAVAIREAALWSAVWVSVALLFGGGVWYFEGQRASLEYLTGYVIEKALSVDNVFVFAVLFRYFNVPAQYQHRVLFWGVFGAIVMRAILIAAGIALLDRFHWLVYAMGAFLVVTGVQLARRDGIPVHPERNPALRLVRRLIPVTPDYVGHRFFVTTPFLAATPLFVVLVLVETTDLLFAVDSIPAILAITRDPFIVYTSNVFAILGLRSLYFLLAGVIDRFTYMKTGIAAILVFVGGKMLLNGTVEVPILLSLAVITAILAIAVIASFMSTRRPATVSTPESDDP